MLTFDVSKNWVILLPANASHIEKAAGDLAHYIGLLASTDGARAPEPLPLLDASDSAPDETIPIIILNYEDRDLSYNGFSWRAAPDRVEILGDSARGLCNGVYSFLEALDISWPSPNEKKLPSPSPKTNYEFPLSANKSYMPSLPLRRYIEKGPLSEGLITWAARQSYDTIIFPLTASEGSRLEQLKEYAEKYALSLEAGV